MSDIGDMLERKRRYKGMLRGLEEALRYCLPGMDEERREWFNQANAIRQLLQKTQEDINKHGGGPAWDAIANSVGKS